MARFGEEFPYLDTGWRLLEGRRVEVQYPGGATEIGIVDTVTGDGLILWLRQDGVSPTPLGREFTGNLDSTRIRPRMRKLLLEGRRIFKALFGESQLRMTGSDQSGVGGGDHNGCTVSALFA